MIIAVASGKGGTGKTTVAVALADAVPGQVQLLDCDVEEPNCHIFARPVIEAREPVTAMVPVVDPERCDACGKCASVCQFNAIVAMGSEPLIFPEMCHGCGGCLLVCPREALQESTREIGTVETGFGDGFVFIQGQLDVGQVLATPVIRAVRNHIDQAALAIIDCPPGTACPMVAAVRDADYVLLVTEPTPFGLHDLKLAVDTVRELGLPCGVVVNRSDGEDSLITEYCGGEGIPVLLRIPFDRHVAEAYSRGEMLLTALPELRDGLIGVVSRIEVLAAEFAEVK